MKSRSFTIKIPEKEPSKFELFVKKIARKQNEAMFEALKRQDPGTLRPALTIGKLLAYLDASAFYVLGIAAIYASLYAMTHWSFILFPAIAFLILILMAWIMRPHIGKLPPRYLTRQDAPTLYDLTDAIVEHLGIIAPVDAIAFNDTFNAGYARVGLPRKTLILLGSPLWNALSSQEKVALLAHELSHGKHGDHSRRFFVQTVCDGLMTWVDTVYPRWFVLRSRWDILLDFKSLYAFVITRPALWNARLLYYLLSWESRRAEYLADYSASTLAGTEATRMLLGKLYFAKALHDIRTSPWRRYVKFDSADFYRQVRETPLSELERINDIDPEELARLDLSHPPIGYRMQILSAHFVAEPQITLSEEQDKQITQEVNDALSKNKRVSHDDPEFWNVRKKNR